LAKWADDGLLVHFRPEPFRCDVKEGRLSALVELSGELDLATVEAVRETLRSLMASKRSLTLDLRRLTFIDSTGLRLVLEIDAASRQDGFNFALVKGPETVQRLFAISGTLDRLVFVDAPDDLVPPQ
jgi:anti-sigma B factor antagonist